MNCKTKTCSKCKGVLVLNSFHNSKYSKDGLKSSCKLCVKQYQTDNKEKTKQYCIDSKDRIKKWRKDNAEKLKNARKEYRKNNQDKIKQSKQKHYRENQDKIKQYYIDNKDRVRQYQVDNKEKIKKIRNKYYRENIDKFSASTKQYKKDNAEKVKQWAKEWRNNNLPLSNFHSAKRRATKRQATPKWLTKDHLKEMREIYKDAQDIRWLNEEDLHVDHIVPLTSPLVCGLHVPWNLQILTASTNLSKKNKLSS